MQSEYIIAVTAVAVEGRPACPSWHLHGIRTTGEILKHSRVVACADSRARLSIG